MAISRQRKVELVEQLQDIFARSCLVVVFHQTGLEAGGAAGLRRRVRDAGGQILVTKNTLVRRAIFGTKYSDLDGAFRGVTSVAVAFDDQAIVPVAKEVHAFVGEHAKEKGKEMAAVLAGALYERLLSPEDVKELSTLPSIDVLRAQMIGLLQAPASKLARLLQEPGGQIARVLSARGES